MVDEFVGILTAAATDDALRAIYLTGAGEDFCAGADWVATNTGGRNAPAPATSSGASRTPRTAWSNCIASIQLPVVCAVRGWAVGLGCNLALAADFTVADDRRDAVGTVHRPRIQPGFRRRPGCCPDSPGWPGPSACCCSARRSPAPTPPTGD